MTRARAKVTCPGHLPLTTAVFDEGWSVTMAAPESWRNG
jgi:hypothetical protein